MTKEEKILCALYGIKSVLNDLGLEDIKNKLELKDGSTETIDCVNVLQEFIVDYVNSNQPTNIDKETAKKPVLDKNRLDKDIKDIYDENGCIDPYVCVCPRCKKCGFYDFEYEQKFDYCGYCGQKIDWSDKNNEKNNR